MSDDVVNLTEAPNEDEAAVICGYLESRGIRATYDTGGVLGPVMSYPGTFVTGGEGLGRQEILVNSKDLAKAQGALAEVPK